MVPYYACLKGLFGGVFKITSENKILFTHGIVRSKKRARSFFSPRGVFGHDFNFAPFLNHKSPHFSNKNRPIFFWTWNFWCKYWCKKVENFTSFCTKFGAILFLYLHHISAKTWCKKFQFCTIFVPHILWTSCILQRFQIYCEKATHRFCTILVQK